MSVYSPARLTKKVLHISGIVQGVGFRPFVFNLALKYELNGFVRNQGASLEIVVVGKEHIITKFIEEIKSKTPRLALIKDFQVDSLGVNDNDFLPNNGFKILPSTCENTTLHFVAPDSNTCANCLAELFDKNNRRYFYPFINCTNCGPRFTLIEKLPYDRENTTMRSFKMCDLCNAEYNDPTNRRFHAQPNACSDCGPVLEYVSSTMRLSNKESQIIIEKINQDLLAGKIIAIKSLGGFHLACDATNESAVILLRQRKARPAKPFALMMKGLAMVKEYCQIDLDEEQLLIGEQRPIVLLEKKQTVKSIPLASSIAHDTPLLGVMLSYTPLQHLICNTFDRPLVMTSGNISDEPITKNNDEARIKLTEITDTFVFNNRQIAERFDDSIVRVTKKQAVLIRRSRSFAPQPIELKWFTQKSILALGGQMKNTFCFFKKNQAFLSPHIGDLDNIETQMSLEKSIKRHMHLFNLEPELIACDMHPNYVTTNLAEQLATKFNLSIVRTQHHHAHIVSCMAEHGLSNKVIGIALDGTGYGPDNTIWGGEILVSDFQAFERFASLEPVIMPGGLQSIINPWRMALAYISKLDNSECTQSYMRELESSVYVRSISLVQQQINRQFNSPVTSSCGRLFDAISSILGLCHISLYEGQAAIALETMAKAAKISEEHYSYSILPNNSEVAPHAAKYHINVTSMIKQILKEKYLCVSLSKIAYKFHFTLAKIITETCLMIQQNRIAPQKADNLNTVCLGGGVFQNKLLIELTKNLLEQNNFKVYFSQQVPTNDGGLSLGQAVIAAGQNNSLVL